MADELIIPKGLRCNAFGCSRRAVFIGFCQPHLDVMPGSLRYEYERARASAKRNRLLTGRLRAATENVIMFLARHDREEVLRRKRLTEASASEAEVLAEAEERLAAAPVVPPRKDH